MSSAEFPLLRRLELKTVALTVDLLQALVKSSWPQLESLTLWSGQSSQFGDDAGRRAPSAEDFDALLTSDHFPSLVSLDLSNNDITDALCERVVKSPLLPQLRALTLSMGTLGAKGAGVLMKHRDRLRHLELELSDNYLDGDTVARLRSVFPEIETGEQRVADDERYCSVWE